jgi:hypothetical protein
MKTSLCLRPENLLFRAKHLLSGANRTSVANRGQGAASEIRLLTARAFASSGPCGYLRLVSEQVIA